MRHAKPIQRLVALGLLALPVRIFAQANLEDILNGRATVEPKTSVAPSSSQFPDRWYPERTPAIIPTFFPGSPYIAVKETRTIHKLENGENFTWVQRHPRMRDSAGRERSEANSGKQDGTDVYSVQVIDPVSHCSFEWRFLANGLSLPPDERIAVVRCATRNAAYLSLDMQQIVMDYKPSASSGETSEKFTGIKDGISYVGERNFIGSRTSGVEIWYSKDMHLQLRTATINRDGSYGDSEELLQIQRTEPDVQLFYPPLDYTIYTESELKALGRRRIEERERQNR